ncbi:transposase [Roseomonas sp. M0104]|uniref:Transposase n=1 Tax=Teichococcus coralli TaxID=2545983 RepID=A0A845BKQ5_9PROT|nr:transposase [Pseudoroseomonas coralli]
MSALLPHVLPQAPEGRRSTDLRARMDAIFHLAQTAGDPWRLLPERHGKPDTVSRFFRHLTHAGLWHRLPEMLARTDLAPGHPLRQIEYAICRATRLGGMPLLLLIRRLGLRTALNGPPWLLPDPLLSETLARALPALLLDARNGLRVLRDGLRSARSLAASAAGRRRIPCLVRLAWP